MSEPTPTIPSAPAASISRCWSGYLAGTPGGTVVPNLVARGTGNYVNFDFFTNVAGAPPASTLLPGGQTELLLVETDARNYGANGLLLLNNSNGFNPPAPEPSTLSMAAIALLGLALTYVRKS